MTIGNDSSQLDPLKLHAGDLPDIQGLIVRGYNLPQVRHFVLTIGDAAAALSFFDALTSGAGELTITSAAPWPGGKKPPYALNLGLTATGLEALRLPGEVYFNVGNFGPFLGGAVAAAETVGDTGANAPATWIEKLNQANAGAAHLLLSLYTKGDADREKYSTILRTMFRDVIPSQGDSDHDVLEFDVDAITRTDPSTGRTSHKIHFGYTDGISNPIVDAEGLPPLRPKQLPYVAAWRFVLRNGSMTNYNMPKPLPLTQNASFSAFRILEQNVGAFEAFLDTAGGSEARELLAAKLCGRWRNGNPLVARPDAPGDKELPDNELRDFGYGTDTVGDPCPYSAHTRRVNPRGGPGVDSVDDNPAGRQKNRVMRRANAYGPAYQGQPDGKPRGLAGHFIGANLREQFEFLMEVWVNQDGFAGWPAKAGIDPLLGNVPPDSTFTYWLPGQPKPKAETVPGLSRFVTTRGGLYCMLPSLTGIRWMAANGNNSDPWKIPSLS